MEREKKFSEERCILKKSYSASFESIERYNSTIAIPKGCSRCENPHKMHTCGSINIAG